MIKSVNHKQTEFNQTHYSFTTNNYHSFHLTDARKKVKIQYPLIVIKKCILCNRIFSTNVNINFLNLIKDVSQNSMANNFHPHETLDMILSKPEGR